MDFTVLHGNRFANLRHFRIKSGASIVEIAKLIAQLRGYQREVDQAIEVLQKLADRRSGKSATRRAVSAETRNKMAAAQKKRWAKNQNNRASA